MEEMIAPFSDGSGIATGPDISHLLADTSLESVDDALASAYPGRYFRYVDDIVIVAQPGQVNGVRQSIKSAFDALELGVHQDKDDEVSTEDWLSQGRTMVDGVKEGSFEALVFRLKLFLARHPNEFEALRSAVCNAGLSLPLHRLRTSSLDQTFTQKMRRFIVTGQWSILRQVWADTPGTLVDIALRLRESLLHELSELASSELPSGPTIRKWKIQRWRYVTNRLVYLLAGSDWRTVKTAVDSVPDLYDTSTLLHALVDDDISGLLRVPGRAVSTFATIRRSALPSKAKILLPRLLDESAVHSAAILLLSDVAELGANAEISDNNTPRRYLAFCAGISPPTLERARNCYLDQVTCLQLGRDPAERIMSLDAPVEWSEVLPLEGIELGDSS